MSRRQLLQLGFSEEAIEHRLAKGRLHQITRGVYAVGWPQLNTHRRWMAAVLAYQPDAALSHRSAAALWGIGKERGRRVDVTVRRRCECRRSWIHVRGRQALRAMEFVSHNGIPVTRPTRTLLDLATELDSQTLERAVNEADKRDLIDPETLREELDNLGGQRGVPTLRKLLNKHTFRLSDSELEVLFRPLAVAAGLPQPLTKTWVNGFEVDFLWPDLGLVVETDGLRYHRTAATQTRDHLRDQAHTAAGLTTLRFTHWQVKHEHQHVQAVLRQTAANVRRARPTFPVLQHGKSRHT